MSTLVVYSSKHGCTESCATKLAEYLKADIVNLTKENSVSLDKYDTVLIGSSIYAGRIGSALSQFCSSELSSLKTKTIGLFICCGLEEKALAQMEVAFPRELVNAAKAKGYFGYSFTNLGFFEKMITKAIGAPLGKTDIRTEEIESFAKKFKQGA